MDALTRCLLKKPFNQTSIKDIAAAAKINHGMLHYYYKSKEDILLNYIEFVIEDYKTIFEDWMASKTPDFKDPEDMLRACLDFAYHRITSNRDLSKIFIEFQELAIYNPKIKKKLRKAYSEWIETVHILLTRACKEEASVPHISAGLVAFSEGISLLSLILDKDDAEIKKLFKAFQEQFIQYFMKSITQ
ncbi:TetR/AcrR family transcriptional regulator [Desulfosudis oleivorans]|nr:TetR/AcrR family transcriptional regulator [Desulfosudis oleivorans]